MIKKSLVLTIIILSLLSFFNCSSEEKASEYFIQGKQFYLNKQLKEAAEKFEDSISKKSDFLPAYIMLGKTYYFDGKFDKSEEVFQKANKKFPGNATSMFWLARIYLLDDTKLDKAQDNLEKILQTDDSYFEANYYLAKIYEKKGNIKEALIQYNRAKLIKLAFKKIHKDLSDLYIKSGLNERAEAELAEMELMNR